MNNVTISIVCITYNHFNYIGKAIESFLSQKTNFNYEIIIHDDASTDGTTQIIEKYQKKYPNLIKPIFQKENKYSKNINICKKYILPIVKGKYIALCEGDDYWTDNYKLQKQVNALETNSDCAISSHYCKCINVKNNKCCGYYPNKNLINKTGAVDRLDFLNIELFSSIHYNSLLIRTSEWKKYFIEKPNFVNGFSVGDMPLILYFVKNSRLFFIAEEMSVYNNGVPGSWTERIVNNKLNRIKDYEINLNGLIKYKDLYEMDTKEYYLINKKIKQNKYIIECLKHNFSIIFSKEYKNEFNQFSILYKIKLVLLYLVNKYGAKKC